MEKLNLTNCKSNEEIVKAIADRVNSVSLDALTKEVNKHFINQNKATRAIYIGLSMGMNVFLSGPGGYGKSTLVKFILDYYGIPSHTIVGYKDMPVDSLLGIPNMQKLLQDSEYEIDFRKSIFGKRGVIIGEEFTDILPSTAAALKDVLTEKGLRAADGKTESYISNMIVCANKSYVEVSDNESTRALYDERFPLKVEVAWDFHDAYMYMKLLKLKFPSANEKSLYFMAKLFENNYMEHNNTITPRKALNITKVFLDKGVDYILDFELNTDMITMIRRSADAEYDKFNKEKILDDIKKHIESIPKKNDYYVLNILYALHKLSKLKVKEEYLNKYMATVKHLEALLHNSSSALLEPVRDLDKKLKLLDD